MLNVKNSTVRRLSAPAVSVLGAESGVAPPVNLFSETDDKKLFFSFSFTAFLSAQ